MRKRFLVAAAGLLVASGLTLASPAAKEGTWTGSVNDDACGAKMIDGACAKKCVDEKGAKYALITSDKKVYILNPQADAAKHAGHTVTVKGTLDGDTITAASITM